VFLSFYILRITINLSYNVRNGFPFSTWGEYVFMLGQTIIILFLFDLYTGTFRFIQWGLYFGLLYSLFSPIIITQERLVIAQQIAIPVFIFSRASQIILNFKVSHFGNLTFFRTVMLVLCLVSLFSYNSQVQLQESLQQFKKYMIFSF
jgi:mannose-P-dolichol utilization defect 1